MAQIEILSEQGLPGRWQFGIQSLDDDGILRMHEVSLAWPDYNLWSPDGSDNPSDVVDAVMNFLLSRLSSAEIPAIFDASFARRRFPHEADRLIPRLIGR